MTLCTSDQVFGAIPARTNETYRYRKTATAASPLVAVSASWEGTWEIGHTPRSSATPKTWQRSRNWVLGNRNIGRGYRRECRSWSMRKRITATPLPCENWRREGMSSWPNTEFDAMVHEPRPCVAVDANGFVDKKQLQAVRKYWRAVARAKQKLGFAQEERCR